MSTNGYDAVTWMRCRTAFQYPQQPRSEHMTHPAPQSMFAVPIDNHGHCAGAAGPLVRVVESGDFERPSRAGVEPAVDAEVTFELPLGFLVNGIIQDRGLEPLFANRLLSAPTGRRHELR